MTERIVRKWWKRFEQQGLTGLEDAPRPGAPARYTVENKARVLEAALTRPTDLGLAFNCWTFERLAAYVHEHLGIQMKKTRIFEILHKEGLRWRQQETWFGERLDPDFAKKRGPSSGWLYRSLRVRAASTSVEVRLESSSPLAHHRQAFSIRVDGCVY